jgi:hypothetical protein
MANMVVIAFNGASWRMTVVLECLAEGKDLRLRPENSRVPRERVRWRRARTPRPHPLDELERAPNRLRHCLPEDRPEHAA